MIQSITEIHRPLYGERPLGKPNLLHDKSYQQYKTKSWIKKLLMV
jgi:hypothetical protein